MRSHARLFPWLVALLMAVPLHAQLVKVDIGHHVLGDTLVLHDLHDDRQFLPGVGAEVPGLDVAKTFRVRHWIGPANHAADRVAVDSTWALLADTKDSVRAGHGLHWIRFTLVPAADLKDVPLVMAVDGKANYEIYLNGRFLMRSSGTDAFGAMADNKERRNLVPFRLACDGLPETVAVRIAAKQDASFTDTGFRMSLHEGDLFYGQQRMTTHYGIYIGINVVVFLFSLVMWWSDRSARGWLFLGLLSAMDVIGTYAELGTDLMVVGMGETMLNAWRVVAMLILPWQFYLLMRVLGMLRGTEPRRRLKWGLAGTILSSLVLGGLGVFISMKFSIDRSDATGWWLVPLVLAGVAIVLVAVVITWFFFLVIRLGYGLMRTKGNERWVGAGVIVSFVVAVVVRMVGAMLHGQVSDWMALVGDYASHAAVPLFTGVYLSIRSAHQNRLVMRQRDELDAEVKERTAELRSEKERSEELLLNILPEEVAAELKVKGHADARLIEQVTVMFTDFRGFTLLSEKLGPRELVADIHECFSAFDRIMEKHGVEKIKTIGDAYMAAGGLPVPNTSHATDTVRAALEVQAFIEGLRRRKQAQGQPFFEIRIGVHTGPVVAGIVGVKKFQYDIWGDTVNTASRMESSGQVGRVNISASTHLLVKDDPGFLFTPRGLVEAKGKGAMEMYFVERAGSVG